MEEVLMPDALSKDELSESIQEAVVVAGSSANASQGPTKGTPESGLAASSLETAFLT